jgi:putative two-component system response regulator
LDTARLRRHTAWTLRRGAYSAERRVTASRAEKGRPLFFMIGPDLKDARVLVIDDEHANVRLLERLLHLWGFVDVVTTTVSAEVPELYRTSRPDILFLDLQMPDPNGFRLMELLADEIHGPTRLPVLVLTADITPDVKKRALGSGARDFLTKPFDPTEVELRLRNLLETRRLQLELQSHNETLERRVLDRTRDLDMARLETLERLALAGEYRDDNTHEHAQRVGRSAARLAEALGRPAYEVELFRRAAPLHDIGKIGVPDAILLKPGKLDPGELEVMKSHARIGHQILSGSGSRVLRVSAEIALTHHERWDGCGYPAGIKGAEIPLCGRITAVADVFDALMHRRPYKEAWSLDAALAEIHDGSGRHFDPAVVDVFEASDPESLLAPIANGGANGLPASTPARVIGVAE